MILLHSELEGAEIPLDPQSDPRFYSTFLASRPEVLETDAIKLINRLQKQYPLVRCHIVHLSAASGIPIIREARAAGLNLTVETCFHYLFLHSADIPNGHPEFKCCPPIREDSNRDQLWKALQEGVIDCVVSDHSPCVAELKKIEEGDVMAAWGGISTLGLGLSLLWTEGKQRGATIADLVRWTCEKTAEHAGLKASKGRLQVGCDADMIIWDPDAVFTVLSLMLGAYIFMTQCSRSRRNLYISKTSFHPTSGVSCVGVSRQLTCVGTKSLSAAQDSRDFHREGSSCDLEDRNFEKLFRKVIVREASG